MSADPAALVAAVDARARRMETPCGEGTLVWRGWGEGPPLVLFHGGSGAWSHWIRNIDALAGAGRAVWAADLPGHGDSAMPPEPTHAAISAALAEGLARLPDCAAPVDLVGFSFGGVVAGNLAALHPGHVRRLVVVGSGGLDTPVGHVELRKVSGLVGEAREAAITHNLLQIMLHHASSVDALARHLLIANGHRAKLYPAGLVRPDRLKTALSDVRCPVDAIWGEHDRIHYDPAAQHAAIRAVQPAARMRVIAGAGHWAMYERAASFDAALLELLADGRPVR